MIHTSVAVNNRSTPPFTSVSSSRLDEFLAVRLVLPPWRAAFRFVNATMPWLDLFLRFMSEGYLEMPPWATLHILASRDVIRAGLLTGCAEAWQDASVSILPLK